MLSSTRLISTRQCFNKIVIKNIGVEEISKRHASKVEEILAQELSSLFPFVSFPLSQRCRWRRPAVPPFQSVRFFHLSTDDGFKLQLLSNWENKSVLLTLSHLFFPINSISCLSVANQPAPKAFQQPIEYTYIASKMIR